jgi:Na+-driven multidrug efflux pump
MRALVSKWILAEGVLIFSLFSHGAGAITNILLNLILIPISGGYGAAIATVVSYAVAAYFSFMIFQRTRPMVRVMTLAFYAPLRILMKRA